ncbi:MAG TPA: hypothetical protein VNF29_03725 [Candidatus Binataceae bacterium]|nr:hypothetical protein [Candidatus Binataceae bacterium]
MPNFPYAPEIIAVAVILILVFVSVVRRIIFLLLRIAIAIGAVVVAVGGISLLMNNETIFDKPGVEARAIRFLTHKSAATSEKGLGSATCAWPDAQPSASPSAAAASAPPEVSAAAPRRKKERHRHHADTGSAPNPAAAASPAQSASGPADDDYPELMTPSYPGIAPSRLFALSRQVIDSLGGWKILSANPTTGVIECGYTSRILHEQDEVRITVTSNSEIDLCARAESARPDSTSILRWFPGDFGASVGHIKQFIETMDPMMDEVYKQEQEKENAKKPSGSP